MGSYQAGYLTATLVYLGTKMKITLLLVIIGVYSVNCLNLKEKEGKTKNFPENMKNDFKSFVTDIYVAGTGHGTMARDIKNKMNIIKPGGRWCHLNARDTTAT